MLLVAGCGGTATQPAETGTPTTTVRTGTTATTPATTAGPDTTTPGYRSADVDPATVKRDALLAMRAVETYAVTFRTTRDVRANRVTRTIDIVSSGVFDRTDDELRVNRTISGPGGNVTARTYVVNRTLYERNRAYLRRYDSKWVKLDLSGNFSRRWALLDTLSRQRTLLNRSTVEVLGATTLAGTDAYVLRADVNETAYSRLLEARTEGATEVNVTDATVTFWIAADTGRPLRSAGTVNRTAVIDGQVVSVDEEYRLRFAAYNASVDVTLPDAAGTAVGIGNDTEAGAGS